MTSSSKRPALMANPGLAAAYASLGGRGAATAEPAPPVESAWQRWEMQTIGTPAARRAGTFATRALQEAAPAAPPRPSAPSLEDALLARLRSDARKAGEAEGRREGLARGHAEGLAAGLREGRAEGLALAAAQAEQLRALAQSLPAALRDAEAQVSDALIALALDVARQVIHHSLSVEPAWIVALVREQLHAEPALQGEPRLLLHPDDVALVRASLGTELQDAGWQVRPDDSMARGGCRVQCTGAEVDATLPTRWERVTAALGPTAKALHA